jgi:hypothetical protein
MGYYDIPTNLYDELNKTAPTGTKTAVNPSVPKKKTINYGDVGGGGNILQKIGSTVGKGIGLLNKPSEWTEFKLSPVLFGKGTTTYKQGLEKSGWTPQAAQIGEFAGQFTLDPLNLLGVPAVVKGIGKGLKYASKSLKPVVGVAQKGTELLGKTKFVKSLAEKFTSMPKIPKLLPETKSMAEDFLRMQPKTRSEYASAITRGINARMKVGQSNADIVGTIKKITGKTLSKLDDNELASLYEKVKTGYGTAMEGKTKIPVYLRESLEDMVHAASMDKDIGFVEKYFRPFWQTVEKYDKGGVLRKVYSKLSVANDSFEKARDSIKTFRALNYGKLTEDGRNLVSEILRQATKEEDIIRVGKKIGASDDVVNAAIATRAKLNELIDMANIVRSKRGLPKIPKIENYVTNLIDTRLLDAEKMTEIAQKTGDTDALQRIAELGADKTYHIDRELMPLLNEGIVTSRVQSPFYKKRMIPNAADLDILKTNDIDRILQAYSDSVMKDIYFGSAVDMTRNLTKFMPADLQKLTNDMVDYGMMRKWTPTDRLLSRGMGDLNFRNLSGTYSELTYKGGLGFNFRSPFQNFSQQVLTYSQVGLKNMKDGYNHLLSPTDFDQILLKNSDIMRNRITESAYKATGIKEAIRDLAKPLPPTGQGSKISHLANRLGMMFFNMSEQTNVAQGFLAGSYKKIDELGGLEKVMNNADLLDEVVKEGDRVAKITQFSYRRMDLPPAMWSSLGRLLLQYQTYPINLIFYLERLKGTDKWGRLVAGTNAVNKIYQEVFGYSPFDWSNLITRGTDYGGYSLAGSPFATQVGAGVNAMATNLSPTATEKQKTASMKNLWKKSKILIPYELGAERLYNVATGEQDWTSLFGRKESPNQVINEPLFPKKKTLTPRI